MTDRAQDLFDQLVAGGENGIDELIADRWSEELFLDFKRSSDSGRGRRLSGDDRRNLSKAISGFGNSEGGIVVWGVECSGDQDVARDKYPVEDAARFKSLLEGAVSGCTVPPHVQVEHAAIVCEDGTSGFVVSHIPKSLNTPHQSVAGSRYYIRAGNSFVPAPHGVIAGLFGRRPQPNVFHNFGLDAAKRTERRRIQIDLGIWVHNDGPGVARELYASLTIQRVPGPNCTVSVQTLEQDSWTGTLALRRRWSLTTKPDYRLAPTGTTQPMVCRIELEPPFNDDLRIEILVGAHSGIPYHDSIEVGPDQLTTSFETVFHALVDEDATYDPHKMSEDLLGLTNTIENA